MLKNFNKTDVDHIYYKQNMTEARAQLITIYGSSEYANHIRNDDWDEEDEYLICDIEKLRFYSYFLIEAFLDQGRCKKCVFPEIVNNTKGNLNY